MHRAQVHLETRSESRATCGDEIGLEDQLEADRQVVRYAAFGVEENLFLDLDRRLGRNVEFSTDLRSENANLVVRNGARVAANDAETRNCTTVEDDILLRPKRGSY